MVKYENSLARTTRNPYRTSFVSVLDHRSISYSPASFWNSDHARSRSSSTSPLRLEVLEQRVDHVFESILHRLLSEILFVDVDVAEQEETVRAVTAAVVDQQRVTAELRRRDCVGFLGVDVVAMIGEQELEVEGRESSEAGFVERLRIDLRFGLGEEFVVVLPENRAPSGQRLRGGDGADGVRFHGQTRGGGRSRR